MTEVQLKWLRRVISKLSPEERRLWTDRFDRLERYADKRCKILAEAVWAERDPDTGLYRDPIAAIDTLLKYSAQTFRHWDYTTVLATLASFEA